MSKRQLISTKLSTYIPWKTWQRMAHTPKSSASLHRIITYEYPLEAILAIYYLSATGYLPAKFPHDQWNEAVRWHGDTKLAAIIHNEAEWADAKIILAKLENVVVEAESQHGVGCPTFILMMSSWSQLDANHEIFSRMHRVRRLMCEV